MISRTMATQEKESVTAMMKAPVKPMTITVIYDLLFFSIRCQIEPIKVASRPVSIRISSMYES